MSDELAPPPPPPPPLTNRVKALATLAVVYGQQILGSLSQDDLVALVAHADYARGLRSLQYALDTAAAQGRGAFSYFMACTGGDEEAARRMQAEAIQAQVAARAARGA